LQKNRNIPHTKSSGTRDVIDLPHKDGGTICTLAMPSPHRSESVAVDRNGYVNESEVSLQLKIKLKVTLQLKIKVKICFYPLIMHLISITEISFTR
jgi:hypothetical protein